MKAEKVFNFVYAIGAAIVVYGAWLKITHKQTADLFLTIGLLTEVAIFVIIGLQELLKKSTTDITAYPKVESSNNTELTESVNNLTKTIKQIFNR